MITHLLPIAVIFVALEHLGFLVLEMFFWTKPLGMKIFRTTKSVAESSKALAANQGLYNGFLSAGLFWGLMIPDQTQAEDTIGFFLACVIVAAIFGAFTVNKRIFFVQGIPALIALGLLILT
ncbi:MAG: DUF1304 domain-containing protein [Bdellovibrionales bacterium]|nr:DUF1304 domain-containing protein [Bdellovibrionales bacterium]